MTWNPDTYLHFAAQRFQPALDLMARLPDLAARRIVDLGCGTGELTCLLAQRFAQARVLGVDRSAEMLERARQQAQPRLAWLQADAATWDPEQPVDLLFSNACLQWLPDHAVLLPRLLADLAPRGVLAVQMPRNFASPSHVLAREVSAAGPWAPRLAGIWREQPVATPEQYWRWLSPGCASIDVWETEYLHALQGEDAVLDWVSGTLLTPVHGVLQGRMLQDFRTAYAARLRVAYPREADGTTLFPFRRLFLVARR